MSRVARMPSKERINKKVIDQQNSASDCGLASSGSKNFVPTGELGNGGANIERSSPSIHPSFPKVLDEKSYRAANMKLILLVSSENSCLWLVYLVNKTRCKMSNALDLSDCGPGESIFVCGHSSSKRRIDKLSLISSLQRIN